MRHTKTYPIINNSDTSKFPGYVHLKSTFKVLKGQCHELDIFLKV